MITDTRFQVTLSATTSGGTAYFPAPYRCTVRDVRATGQAAVSSIAAVAATTVPIGVSYGSTTLGAVAVPAAARDMAAGALGVYTPDASSGDTVVSAEGALKFDIPAANIAATGAFVLDIVLDPYARSV